MGDISQMNFVELFIDIFNNKEKNKEKNKIVSKYASIIYQMYGKLNKSMLDKNFTKDQIMDIIGISEEELSSLLKS